MSSPIKANLDNHPLSLFRPFSGGLALPPESLPTVQPVKQVVGIFRDVIAVPPSSPTRRGVPPSPTRGPVPPIPLRQQPTSSSTSPAYISDSPPSPSSPVHFSKMMRRFDSTSSLDFLASDEFSRPDVERPTSTRSLDSTSPVSMVAGMDIMASPRHTPIVMKSDNEVSVFKKTYHLLESLRDQLVKEKGNNPKLMEDFRDMRAVFNAFIPSSLPKDRKLVSNVNQFALEIEIVIAQNKG